MDGWMVRLSDVQLSVLGVMCMKDKYDEFDVLKQLELLCAKE